MKTLRHLRIGFPGLVVALVVALVAITVPCAAAPLEPVTLGFGPSLTSALDVIADNQGFFEQEGLKATLREYARGSKAIEAVLSGEADIASSTAFAVVTASLDRDDLRIVSTVAVAGNDNMVVARKDRGIRSVADLAGKKVGTLKGGLSQYVLDLILLGNGLLPKDVVIVLDEPAPLHERLVSGELDALCTFGSWFDKANKALGANAVVFGDESVVRVTTFMTALQRRIRENPGLFEKVVRAYIRAEDFIRRNPDRSCDIVAARFKLDRDAARKIWKPNLFHVALDQAIVMDLENLARWQIQTGPRKGARVPNYLDFISFGILEGIDPKRVTVIH